MTSYKVNECFYSLQGEGIRAGSPNLFLRFSGCNQICKVDTHGFDCDTEFVSGRKLTSSEIVDELSSLGPKCDWIVVTGGEPALQIDSELIDCLHEAGFKLAIETNGSVLVAIVLQEKKGKWIITDERGRESQLSSDRLYLIQDSSKVNTNSSGERLAYLKSLSEEAKGLAASIELEDIWEVLSEARQEVTVKEITELAFNKDTPTKRLATRRALLDDKIYFKRRKASFEPRTPEIVKELQRQVEVEEKKEIERKNLIECLISRIKDHKTELPAKICEIEQVAVLGSHSPSAKTIIPVIEHVINSTRLDITGSPERKAFELLVAARHFSPHENLPMHRFQRYPEFTEELETEAKKIAEQLSNNLHTEFHNNRVDFTELHAITIDGEDTLDIDDALSLETTRTGYRLSIHISDIAAIIEKNSPLNTEAFRRASSIYCPDLQIPMFPKAISEDAASLTKGSKRLAVSFLVDLTSDFNIRKREIRRSIIRVTDRISYDEVDRLLFSDEAQDSSANSKQAELLLKLWDIADSLENRRLENDAVYFKRREMTPVVKENYHIILESSARNSPSRKLVEEMMILANETAGLFATDNHLPLLFRGQPSPEVEMESVGLDLPEGAARENAQKSCMKRSTYSTNPSPHFGLGLPVYTQVTSPIRRAMDLVNQRQILEFIDLKVSSYNNSEMTELLSTIEIHLSEAFNVQRESNRYWLLKYLEQENIKELQATVVKLTGKRPLAEVDILFTQQPFHPLAPKRITSSASGKKLGEIVRLRIDQLDARSDKLVLTEIPKD